MHFKLSSCILSSEYVIHWKQKSLGKEVGVTGADERPRMSKLTPFIYEPRHEISNNVVCATNKVSDQPAHTGSLIRAFASPLKIL